MQVVALEVLGDAELLRAAGINDEDGIRTALCVFLGRFESSGGRIIGEVSVAVRHRRRNRKW